MKRLGLALFVAVALSTGAQAAESFKIDPSRSTIAFKVRHMLGTAKGKFSKLNGTIVVDRDHPEMDRSDEQLRERIAADADDVASVA